MSKNHPIHGPFPGLDDHLVEPEVTRDQIIGGRLVVDEPSEPPEAILKSRLNFVLRSHVAPGYLAAAGLLTRFDWESDFGSDSCLYKEGVNPETGTRYLEEITFEMVTEQTKRDATEKALWIHRRGVRRIFMVEVEDQQVCEWSADSQSWHPLDCDAQIEDPCLVVPVPVAALFDKTAASIAAMRGMAAQGNPEILRWKAEAKAEDVLKALEVRGLAVNEAQRQEILGCRNLDRLDRWLRRAIVASSVDDALDLPTGPTGRESPAQGI